MPRPGGYFRVPVRQSPSPARRRPVRPRPEVSVQSKPQAAQRPAQRVHTNLRNPLAPLPFQQKPRLEQSSTTQVQEQAAKKVRRAVKALPPSRALPRQPDIAFTPQQRRIVKQRTEASIRKFATQQGVHPQQAVHMLQTSGGPLARQQLRLYKRAYDEDRALSFRAQTRMTSGSVEQDSKLLAAVNNRSQAKPGPKPRGIGGTALAVVKGGGPGLYLAGKAGQKISSRFHEQTASVGATDIGGRFFQDSVDIVAQAIPSTAYAITHPKAAAEGYLKSDPLALALQGKFKEAVKAANEHPGVAVAEVVSAGRAGDNAAGLVARRGRAPATRTFQRVPGTNLTNAIPEPKGYLAGKVGRYADSRNAQRVQKLKDDARTESRAGNFDKARHLRAVAANEDRARLPEHEIKRRVNEFHAQGETRRRQDAAKVDNALPEFKHVGQEAATAVKVQAISHATKGDLNALLGELQHQHDHGPLTGPQKAANRELQTRLEQHLSGEHADPHVIDLKAKQYAAAVNPITRHLIERGMLTTDSATYVPFAVRQGYRHSAERLKTPEYIAHLDAKVAAGKATSAEKAVLRQWQTAQRKSVKQQYIAERAVAAADRRIRRDSPETGPVIHRSEAAGFAKRSAVKEPVYSVRSIETARKVQTEGLDPSRAKRGVFGAGTYVAVGKADRAYRGSAVEAAVDVRKPLVIPNDGAMQALRPYREAAMEKVGREDNAAISQEMTRLIKADGYDSVRIKGAGHAGQDWLVVFDRRQIRTVAPRASVTVGGISREAAAKIAEEHGARLHGYEEQAGRSIVHLSGPRAASEAAAERLAAESGAPVRAFHELDGGDGVAYFVDGKLFGVEVKGNSTTLERLHGKYGDHLEVTYGDARDIHGQARGQLPATRGEAGRQGASRQAGAQLARLGREPRSVLARLEKVRANEAFLERQYRKAQENARAATVRANELKPPKGSRYRKPGFAVPDVAAQLREAQRLRDEAKVAREAGDTTKANNLERQAVTIRERVERLPQPRVNGPELIDAVSQKMRDAGYSPEEIAFVTQKPGLSSAGAYFIDWTQRQGIGGPHRTGEATLTGALPSHEGVLRENARRLQSLVSVDENFTAFISEFGLRDQATAKTFRTAGKVRDAAREMMFTADGHEIPGAYEWTPVRINPWGGRQEQLQALLDDVNAEGLVEGIAAKDGSNPVLEAIQQALETHTLPDDAPGEFALIPKAAADQMLAHTRVLNPSDGLKVARFLNTAFRKTVLATSVPWITGNIVEGLLRAGIERAGLGSYKRLKLVLEVLERINPAAAAELDRRAFGGGQAGLVEKGSIYTAADQFRNSNPLLRKMALSAAVLRRTPGIKQLGDFYKTYTDWVFHSVNHSLEARIQMAIAGRKLFPDMGPVTKRAIEEAAQGLTNTSARVALARAVRRAYGQYDAFGTTNRQLIMLYTPFVAWQLNAVRFLGDVLPKDHPALTAVIAASYNASKEWRENHHMSYFIAGAAPGFLQGSYPTGAGPIRISRYTPFGIATDFPSNFAGAVLPQYHGSLFALSGLDWKGQKIKGADGNPETNPLKLMAIAAQQFAYASVPIASQVDRFIAGGGDPKALLDIVNPLKPVRSSSKSGGSSNPFDSAGSSGSSSSSNPFDH